MPDPVTATDWPLYLKLPWIPRFGIRFELAIDGLSLILVALTLLPSLAARFAGGVAAGDTGDFLYRFGDPARYEQGNPPSVSADWTKATTGHKQIGASHDLQWIDAGVPGDFHKGAANIFRIVAQTPYASETRETIDASRTMEQTLAGIADVLPKTGKAS